MKLPEGYRLLKSKETATSDDLCLAIWRGATEWEKVDGLQGRSQAKAIDYGYIIARRFGSAPTMTATEHIAVTPPPPKSHDFYLVWKRGTIPQHRHPTQAEAEKEARRLANHHGGRFYVLRAVSLAERGEAFLRPMQEGDGTEPLPHSCIEPAW